MDVKKVLIVIVKCNLNNCLTNVKGNCIGGYININKYKREFGCGYFREKFDKKGNLIKLK